MKTLTYNNWTIKEGPFKKVSPSGQSQKTYKCECVCGKTALVYWQHLKRGASKSCGCLSIGEKHGMSKTSLYNSWRAMKNRVSENYFQKQFYYDKGIKMCDEWKNSFTDFKKWSEENGYKEGLQIDRIKNNKGYYPSNCRWVTQVRNLANRDCTLKVVYNGVEHVFMDLIRDKNIKENSVYTIKGRIKRGWSVEDAFDKPIKKGNYGKRKETLGNDS